MHVVGGAFRGILPRANAALDAVEGGDQRRQVVERIVDRRIDRMEARVERALGFLDFDAAEIERITGSVFGDVTERIDTAITELPEDASPFHVARHVMRDIAAGIRQEIAMALVVEDGDEEPAPVTAEAETDDPSAPADEPAADTAKTTANADATMETELDPAA